MTTSASISRCSAGGLGELRAAGAAEHRAAGLDDAAHIPRGERVQVVGEKPGVAVVDAEHFPSLREAGAHDGAHGGVHARRVAAARQDCNLFHSGDSKVACRP
jgi:hypothetical protein